METVKQYIGKKIHVYVEDIDQVLTRLKNKVIPAVEKLASSYRELGIGKFNQDVYNNVMSGKDHEILKQYDELIERELSRVRDGRRTSGGSYILDSIARKSLPRIIEENKTLFKSAAKDLRESFEPASILAKAPKSTDIIISEEQPVIDADSISERYTVYIKNDSEATFFVLLENLSEAYNKVREFINKNHTKSTGTFEADYEIIWPRTDTRFTANYFLLESDEGFLQIDPTRLQFL